MNTLLKRLIRSAFARLGYQIKPLPSGRVNPIHLWDEAGQFSDLYQQIAAFTVVSKQRCFMLFQLAMHTSCLAGDVAEVGVYRGGTARLLAKTLEFTRKQIHLFDTFEGLPLADSTRDPFYFRKGNAFGDTSLESVENYLRDCVGLQLYQGLFPNTAGPVAASRFCFVHVDVDIYQSAMDCCAFFYPRLEKGGVMVFDDYGDVSCPGAKKAVDDYFRDKPESLCYLTTGQCLVFRL